MEKVPSASGVVPKQRPIPWLLRMIEEIYDAAYAYEIAFGDCARDRPQFKYAKLLPDSVRAELDDVPEAPVSAIIMPYFVVDFICKQYGLKLLSSQTCLDLL